MAKSGYIPTAQELDALYQKALVDDPEAIVQLGELNNRLSKRANQRMRDLEKKGLEGTAAYNRAKSYIHYIDYGTFSDYEYFPQSRRLSPEDAYKNIEEASKYLRWQTSSAAGEVRRRNRIVDALQEKHPD